MLPKKLLERKLHEAIGTRGTGLPAGSSCRWKAAMYEDDQAFGGSILQQWTCVMVDGDRYCLLPPDAVDDGLCSPKRSCPWPGCCSPSTTAIPSRSHILARS
jgi:hypothetical protein